MVAKRGSCDMKLNKKVLSLMLATFVLLTNQPATAQAPTADEKAAVIGKPIALMAQPETIRLSSARAMQQIIVTGRYSDGAERDLTALCDLRAEADDIATISPRGLVLPRKDGRTVLVVQAGTCTIRIPVVV